MKLLAWLCIACRPPVSRTFTHISFNDHPGFSGNVRMTNGYWLCFYEVKFRWRVCRKRPGRFTKNGPSWSSGEMVHKVESTFDPQNPEATAEITATAAGNHTWDVQLPEPPGTSAVDSAS